MNSSLLREGASETCVWDYRNGLFHEFFLHLIEVSNPVAGLHLRADPLEHGLAAALQQ